MSAPLQNHSLNRSMDINEQLVGTCSSMREGLLDVLGLVFHCQDQAPLPPWRLVTGIFRLGKSVSKHGRDSHWSSSCEEQIP